MNERELLLDEVWKSQDRAYDLICEYDSLPHKYGEHLLYQSEAYIIDLIATSPNITITELSHITHKTTSACSQTVSKLRNKNLVTQTRNKFNQREYKLSLTDEGKALYESHINLTTICRERFFNNLDDFSNEDLKIFINMQNKMNEAYDRDIYESRNRL